MKKKDKPLNQKRRMKLAMDAKVNKLRGCFIPPSITHKDKRKKTRQQIKSDLKKGEF